MNLVICLLVSRGYVPKSKIRQVVGGYGDQSDEAFERMFERDKEELRELGIPIETGSNDPGGDEEPGYSIRRQEFELPEVRLEPDEAAALGLAARVWQHASLAEATSRAVLKLRAAGVDTDTAPLAAVEPRVAVEEPAFWPLWKRFATVGRSASTTDVGLVRNPFAVGSSRGACCRGTAAGTWSATTSTVRHRDCSACRESSATSPRPGSQPRTWCRPRARFGMRPGC